MNTRDAIQLLEDAAQHFSIATTRYHEAKDRLAVVLRDVRLHQSLKVDTATDSTTLAENMLRTLKARCFDEENDA
jgi:hypothetical protein